MRAILLAGGVGFFVALLGSPIAIRLFRAWGWGQRIREDGPRGHLEKMGTPTMGGIVIMLAVLIAYVAARPASERVTAAGLLVLGVGTALAILGAVDDLINVRQRSLGLSMPAKLIGQAVISIAFAYLALHVAHVNEQLSFIRDTGLRLGLLFYLWVFIMIAASSNAVNLTDGLDGLASGSSALVFAAYVVIAFWEFRHSCGAGISPQFCYDLSAGSTLDLAIVGAGAMGATAGFLWWNAAPAKIFMGDTGSLAIGGMLAALALMTDTQLLLLILGGLYALEATSVIVQVVVFRTTKRRAFRMAPLHHHFELLGWPEFTVIVRFWIIAGLAVAFGLGLFYADFLARGGTG
ncbi:MAG TPA: phospho-N-acetylmuramoyl-pentapeptide-transferase [Actinomycetota bacterium]|nr:phospho-N-acetylmuramoyl-pentapeptide-transferase [Actinomycetota bacterium]